MDSDLMLVGGLFLALLAIPVFLSALPAGRSIRGAVALSVVGSTLMLAAYATKAEGYRPDEIGTVVGSVLERVWW